MDTDKFKRDFLNELEVPSGLESLFDYLPEIYFWVKNTKGQFVMLNQADVQKCGGQTEKDIIGKTDFNFFPRELSENFIKDDQKVVKTGKRIINRIELVPNDDGTISWYSTNKVPLYSRGGTVIGVAGTTRNLKVASSLLQPYSEMSEIIDFISKHYMNPIEVKTLAEMANLSISQFERKFKKTCGRRTRRCRACWNICINVLLRL